MTLAQLDAALAPHGKFVPLGAPLPRQATVGGTLAAGVSGVLRAAYGLPRDWLIGVAVAGADGVITKAGGKVVKNVTGYDLNRLYAGSLGSLAVITEATFKLAPAPPEWAVIAAAFTGLDEAVAAVRDLQNRPYAPLGLHILNPAAARHTAARHTNRDSSARRLRPGGRRHHRRPPRLLAAAPYRRLCPVAGHRRRPPRRAG